MDPFLQTWAALYAVPIAITLAAGLVGVAAAAWRLPLQALLFLALSTVFATTWVGDLQALLRGGAVSDPGAGSRALWTWMPWITLSILAWIHPHRVELTPRSLVALSLALYGPPGLLAGLSLLATGHLESHAPRRRSLIFGIAGLVAVSLLDHAHFSMVILVSRLFELGSDPARRWMALTCGSLTAAGWVALGIWASRSARDASR